MAKEIYGFDSFETAQAVKRLANRMGGGKSGLMYDNFTTSSFQVSYGKVTTLVTAASGNDLGTGKVKLFSWDVEDTTVTKSVSADAIDIDVYNTNESKYAVGDEVLIIKGTSSFLVFPASKEGGVVYATCDAAITATLADNTCTVITGSPSEEVSDKVDIENPGFFTADLGKKVVGSWSHGKYRLVNVEC